MSLSAEEAAKSFGADADRYDRARPSYPQEMVAAVLAATRGRRILDVGIGTGVLARLFRASGCDVLGVEIDARMAEVAERDGFAVEVAKFEEWNVARRSFDAVISGQAWHWVDPAAGAAKAAQALRPGGRLALVWNVFALAPEVAAAFAATYDRVNPGLPFNTWARPAIESYTPIFDRAEGGIRESDAFAEPERWSFEWERQYTRAEWLDQIPTHGGHSLIAPDKLSSLIDGLGADIDAMGGSFTMPYVTMVVTTRRAIS